MMSDKVYQALHSWGKRLFIVQAGASIGTGHYRSGGTGFQQLTLDDSGVDVVAACLKSSRRLEVNASDFLFLLRKGLPQTKKEFSTAAIDDESEQPTNVENSEDAPDDEPTSVLIKRKYIDVADYVIPSREVLPDQLMLSSAGCSSLYDYVDGVMEEGEGSNNEEDDVSGGAVVVTDVIVSVNSESWSGCTASSSSGSGGNESEAVGGEGMHGGGKRRLSKAEKKRLQKTGTPTPAPNATDSTSAADAVTGVPPPEGIHLVLNYEAVLTTNKKGTKYTGYNLKLDVLSPEEICRLLVT